MAAKMDMERSGRLGTLSLVLGFSSLLLLSVLAFALYAANKLTYDHNVKNAIAFLLTAHFFALAPLLHLVGLVLGIVALFLRGQKKLAPVLGILLNLVLPAIGITLTLLWALLSAIPPVR